jgi:hypothetical protein
MRISEEFDSIKDLLYAVLKDHPETRNSDTKLYIKCCEILGAKTTTEMLELPISIISVHKIRQVIQNKEGLYLPDEKVKKIREERNVEARDYMKNQNIG